MKGIFQRQLPGFAEGRLEVERLKITDLSYKPGKKCRISYDIQVRDIVNGASARQTFAAEVEPNGGAEAIYSETQKHDQYTPQYGPAIHLLPELKMVLWGFPNDPVLSNLPELWDRKILSDFISRHLRDFGLPEKAVLLDVQTDRVKYVVGERCTLRHTISFENADGLIIYSKSLNDKQKAERIFATVRTLWESEVCRSGKIIIPEPFLFDPRLKAIFVRGLNGLNADNDLNMINVKSAATTIGHVIAKIHQSVITDLPTRSDQYLISQLDKTTGIIGEEKAARSSRIAALAKTLKETSSGLTPVAPTPIHGAFRLSQLVLVHERFALIDFDGFSMGNPISDVASFVSHLLYLQVKGVLTREDSLVGVRQFCRTYKKTAPWGLPTDVLVWQTAAHLVGKQAKRCLKRGKTNRGRTVDRLLNLCEDILSRELCL